MGRRPAVVMQPRSAGSWWLRVWQRVCYLTWIKAVGTCAFMVVFFWAYFALLEHPRHPPFVMPEIALDRWVAFTPGAFPVYLSLWVYVSLPSAFIGNPRALAGFGIGMTGLCLLCLALFWAWPTQTPPFAIDWGRYPGLDLLKGVDASGNACPSLHVASAVFAACWMHRLLRQLGSPGWALALNWAQALAIGWSTLATRQHVALDALAGAALGFAFAALSLARVPDTGPSTEAESL